MTTPRIRLACQNPALAPGLGPVRQLVAGMLLVALAPALAHAGEARSADFVGVVELFTSQGCVNCPPADKLLSDYADRKGVIALSYHVDYWDYIGWKDTLATRENTERQRAYGKRFKSGSVFTPQIVVNGTAEIAGADAAAVATALGETSPAPPAAVSLTQDSDTLRVAAAATAVSSASPGMPVVVLVTFRDETLVTIGRGENEGHRSRSSHAVLDWRILGAAEADGTEIVLPVATLAVADDGPTGSAAFVQIMHEDGTPGAILAGAMLEIEP